MATTQTPTDPGFSSEKAIALRGETAALAQAEQARAAIQARYIMAARLPRDWDEVRVRLLKECKRPGFAEVARYRKPIGKGVEGPSIRFAEAAIRCMTNILAESAIVYDDEVKRQLRVSVTDLEANVTYPIDVMVEKTVERSKVPDGETALRVRTNSYGKPVYLIHATEDDLLNKVNAQVSKAIRTSGLRLLPGDILEECMEQVLTTLSTRDAQDPDAARKKLADAFSGIGVSPSDLKAYLGHELASTGPAELAELRALYTAIRDGEATWAEALETKGKKAGGAEKLTLDPGKGKLDNLADALEKEKGPAAAATTTPASEEPGAAAGAALLTDQAAETANEIPAPDPYCKIHGPLTSVVHIDKASGKATFTCGAKGCRWSAQK